MEKKSKKKVQKEDLVTCSDRLCPFHGKDKLKIRGRSFEGFVVRKFNKRVTIEFERMLKVPKYERYEKRITRIHSRLPDCLSSQVDLGDLVEVCETRPISKMISSVVTRVVRKSDTGGKNESGKR